MVDFGRIWCLNDAQTLYWLGRCIMVYDPLEQRSNVSICSEEPLVSTALKYFQVQGMHEAIDLMKQRGILGDVPL